MNKYLSIEIADKSLVIDLSTSPVPSLVINLISEDEYNKKSQNKQIHFPTTPKRPLYAITSFSLFIKEKGMFKRMDNRDIFYLKAAGSYCELHTNYGIKVLACSLSHVYEQLNQNVFLRIHRSYAINTNYITRFCGNLCYIKNINKDSAIPISSQYHDVFLNILNVLILNQKQTQENENEYEQY